MTRHLAKFQLLSYNKERSKSEDQSSALIIEKPISSYCEAEWNCPEPELAQILGLQSSGSSRSEASQLVFALRAIALNSLSWINLDGHDLFINAAPEIRGYNTARQPALTVDCVKNLNMLDVKVNTRHDSKVSSPALTPSLRRSTEDLRSRAPPPVEHHCSELPQLTRVGSDDPINDISSIVVGHLLLERSVQVTVISHNSDIDNQDHTIVLGHQVRFPPANSSRYYRFPNYRVSFCFRFGNNVVKNRVMPFTP